MSETMPERWSERRSETIELQKSPEQVFDSDRGKAENEAIEIQRILSRIESMHERHDGVEVCIDRKSSEVEGVSDAASIKIVWCKPYDKEGTMLQLDPIVEGHGVESGIFGYKGRYGIAKRGGEGFEFSPNQKPITVEKLFGCPEADLRIKPTMGRWAIGKDELSMMGGINQQTLYMGLGFLFLSPKWMYIGFHEAGHFPDESDENKAWTKAKRFHTLFYKGKPKLQKSISSGKNAGLFEILERPHRRNDLTVGLIERYGITSHYLAKGARLPKEWKNPKSARGLTMDEVMGDFRKKIEEAQYAFDNFFER